MTTNVPRSVDARSRGAKCLPLQTLGRSLHHDRHKIEPALQQRRSTLGKHREHIRQKHFGFYLSLREDIRPTVVESSRCTAHLYIKIYTGHNTSCIDKCASQRDLFIYTLVCVLSFKNTAIIDIATNSFLYFYFLRVTAGKFRPTYLLFAGNDTVPISM